MSHLVKPLSFRLGKTEPWPHNTLLGTRKSLVSGNLTLTKGIARVARSLLRRKRLYVVRGNIANFNLGRIRYNLLFMPRIKTKPREHSIGAFMRRSIYKPFHWSTESIKAKDYVHLRKEKSARIRRRFRPRRLNRWLTKRMFRGAGKVIWRRQSTLKVFRYDPSDRPSNVAEYLAIASHPTGILSWSMVSATRQHDATTAATVRSLHKLTGNFLHWKQRWNFDRLNRRRFNSRRFSAVVSRILYRPVTISALNLFSYLSSKQVVNYKNHQNHFWNFRYRRYRFQYKNYYDITNAFLAIGLMDNSEEFLLSILKITLPLILKIRKFFKFLDSIIKHMPEIEDKFSVFKISITGKLAGGTKRTKFHSIGYGVLPVQTLSVSASNNFMAYTHIYGEFGLKLIMAKNDKYIAVKALR